MLDKDAVEVRLRKSDKVRKSGSLPAANTRNPTSSCKCFCRLRDGEHSHAVAVYQDLHHQPGMKRWIPALLLLVVALNRAQVQLIHYIADEIGQVPFRQPVSQARGKQQILFRKIGTVGLRHTGNLAYLCCEFQAQSVVRPY